MPTFFLKNRLKNFIFIVSVSFYSIGNGQLIYQKPDSNLIDRANSQAEIAALLIDAGIDFFEEASLIASNGEENISNPEPVNKGKILTVKYKNVKYLVYENVNPQHVYEFNADKNPENIVGKRTRNVKTGKYKIALN